MDTKRRSEVVETKNGARKVDRFRDRSCKETQALEIQVESRMDR